MDQVSILIPTYNRMPFLLEAVRSAIEQTVPAAEILVIDDGSEDGTVEAIERMARQAPRLRVVRQANRGVGAARNRGLREASHEIVCFLDSDDRLAPTALEQGLASFSPEVSMLVFSGHTFGDLDSPRVLTKVLPGDDFTLESLLGADADFNPPWGLARKDHLLAIGGFAEDLPCAVDYDLLLRLCASARPVRNLRKPVYFHRRAPGHRSVSDNQVRNFRTRLLVLDRLEREFNSHCKPLARSLAAARARFQLQFWKACVRAHARDAATVAEARAAIEACWRHQPLRLRLLRNVLLYRSSPALCSSMGLS
jgi:glycosyltransferase involved in cell wall biosynthesis